MDKLLSSLSQSADNVGNKIQSILDKVNENEVQTSSGLSYLEAKHHLLIQYCINLCFYTLLKLEGKKVSDHPIIEDLARLRITIEKLRPLDQKLKYQIDKLVKIAASGASDLAVDPKLKFKANIRSFVPLDQDMITEDGDIVEADGEDLENKKYVVPKISAVAYEDKKAKKENMLKKMRGRAQRSAMAQHLIEEYGDQPIEKNLTIGDEFNPELDKSEKEKARYEEEMFVRLQRTKKDLKKRKRVVLPNELDDLEKLGQIASLEKVNNFDSNKMVQKRKKQKHWKNLMSTRREEEALAVNGDFTDKPDTSMRQAELGASVFNLTNTIIGGGILALPFALKQASLLLGIIFILFSACVVILSSRLLIRTSKIIEPEGVTSYNEISKKAFGWIGPYLVQIVILLFLFGALTGYIVIIGNTIKPFVYRLNLGVDYRLFLVLITFCIIMPVSNLKTMNMLRFISYFSITCIGFLVISIVIKACMSFHNNGIAKFPLFKLEMSFFRSVPIISFAFTFHPSIFPIWSEMKDYSTKTVNRSVLFSTAICCICYSVVGIFGYLTFLDETTDNILSNFGSDLLMDIVKVDYLIIVIFSYPMISLPFRAGLSSLLFKSAETWWRRAIIVLWLVGITFILAISIPSISFVFGLVGATAGQLVICIFPGLFYIILEGNYQPVVIDSNYGTIEAEHVYEHSQPFSADTNKKTFFQKYVSIRKIPAYFLVIYGITFGAIGVAEILMH